MLSKNFRIQNESVADLTNLLIDYKNGSLDDTYFQNNETISVHKPSEFQSVFQQCINDKKLNPDDIDDFVVLALLKKDVFSINQMINEIFMESIFPLESSWKEDPDERLFYVQQRVMINLVNIYETKNGNSTRTHDINKNKERIFNGEMYFIKHIFRPNDPVSYGILFVRTKQTVYLHLKNKNRECVVIITPNLSYEFEEITQLPNLPVFILNTKQIVDGWALTVNKIQGGEYNHVFFIISDPDDISYFSAGHGLVALSRAKKSIHIFVKDLQVLNEMSSLYKGSSYDSDLAKMLDL